ncbi:MAG: hypothetical protein NVV62_03345 [Terricaulis sp.]|nr:hypothetical protein [Terricaulis sp.]
MGQRQGRRGRQRRRYGAKSQRPIAPVWSPGVSPSAEALIQRALTGRPFFDTSAKLYSDLGATGDFKRLFALYSGLTTLNSLATLAEDASLSKSQAAQTLAQFARGLDELKSFFASQQFDDIRLVQARSRGCGANHAGAAHAQRRLHHRDHPSRRALR